MSSKSYLSDRESARSDESIDIEILRSDLISTCNQLLKSLDEYSQVNHIKTIIESTDPKDKTIFQKLMKLHTELVLWLEKEKLLLIGACSIEELATIYCDVFNGFRKKQTQLDNLLSESIEESREYLTNFKQFKRKT